ncbi:MAG: hypothetical protein IKJ06_01620 [Clostridia bacterium]|nr:hypothetical protein [Clostridia bacterium]
MKIFKTNTPLNDNKRDGLLRLLDDLKLCAKNAEKAAENAREQAMFALRAGNSLSRLFPDTDEFDKGKILMVGDTNRFTSKSFCEIYSVYENIFLQAGYDGCHAFVVINRDVFHSLKIPNPLDRRCEYGFTFVPDKDNYSADFDVIADKIKENDNGDLTLYFPIESCPLFKSQITNIADLKKYFEEIRFCGEYPVNEKGAVWVSPETAFPPSFLDEYILSPAVSLAKEYTDRVCVKIPKPDKDNALLFHEKDGKFCWHSKDDLFREILEYVKLKI